MKYSTAVRRLRTVADDLSSQPPWEDTLITEAYVYGSLLDTPPELGWIKLALVVDLPPEEVTWMVRPAVAEATAVRLRFDRTPVVWQWRPAAWPVWNHAIVGAVRFWSAKDGTDEAALAALAGRHIDQLDRVSPPDEEAFVNQLKVERDMARKHLHFVVEAYYDRDWQRDHKGFGVYPADHLWWATAGFLELDDAVNNRR